MINEALYSSKTDEWATPQELYEKLDREFNFTLDPCSTHENAKCANHFTAEDDGLSKDWTGHVVFMNPPYSKVKDWMRKAYEESKAGVDVVCLVPSRTDTKWWHEYVMKAAEIHFIMGRLKFGESRNSAPFPSAVIVFRRDRGIQQSRPCVVSRHR